MFAVHKEGLNGGGGGVGSADTLIESLQYLSKIPLLKGEVRAFILVRGTSKCTLSFQLL